MLTHKKLGLAIAIGLLLAFVGYTLLSPATIHKTFELVSIETEKGTEQVFCLASQTKIKPFYTHTQHFAQLANLSNTEDTRKKIIQCAKDYDNAVSHHEITESALYNNDLDGFFKQAKRDELNPNVPTQYLISRQRLPTLLNTQLAQLQSGSTLSLSAFDIALATSQKEEVSAFMPDLTEILPHQRRALFHLGLKDVLAKAKATTDATLAEDQLNQYQTQMGLALQLGNAQMAGIALNSLLYQAGQQNQEQDYRGGYTSYDYIVANQYCDVDYAKELVAQKIPLSSVHLLNLLSHVGRSQFAGDEIDSYRMFNFNAANQTPLNANAMPQCKTLAQLYSQHLMDINDEQVTFSDGYVNKNTYDALFKVAHDAIFLWWLREDEKKYHSQRVSNTDVVGDAELIPNAVATVMQSQPTSFEQVCAWAQNAHTFHQLVSQLNPKLTNALNALPQRWNQDAQWYKHDSSVCSLSFGITDEYQTQKAGSAYLNQTLAYYKLPCKSQLTQTQDGYELVCQVSTQPWPKPVSPDTATVENANEY